MSEDNDAKAARPERSPVKTDRPEDDRTERGRERDRQRRGERQSRFQPRSSSGGRDRDRGGRRAPADRRIYISNIPYEFRWQELKDLFRTEVGEVAYVELFSDDGEKPRGCGIVEFENAESVKKAVEKMHRWELKGRKLVVKEDFDIERDKYGRPMKGGSSGGGGGGGNAGMSGGSSRPRDEPRSSWQAPAPLPGPIGPTSPAIQNKWGNTYGLSPQFLECLGINGPLVSRVFVANLDYKVDEKKLRDVFRLAGKVTNAELNRDKDGKSRGHGVVEFEHPVEAVQAISMLHNQLLYDRKMTVRMDRVNEKTEGLPSKLPEGLRGIGMGLGAGGNPLLDVSRAAVLPSVVSPSLGLNSSGRFADSPPLPRRSALGYSSGAATLPGGLSVGVGSLGALAGGGDIGSIGGSLGGSLGAGLAGGLGGGSGGYSSGLGGGGTGLGGGLGVGMGGSLAAGLAGGASGGSYGSGGLGSGGGSFMGGGASSHYGSSVGGGYASSNRDYNSSMGGLAGAYPGAVDRDYHGPIYADGPGRDVGGNNGNVRPMDTIVVKNLPQSISWQILRDQFRNVGDVKFAEIRNKDMGLIRFGSERDAQRAVKLMDRTRFEGHTIDVSLF
ncbi:myelin expression factor 2-like isoform X2 [Ischnura elegans]|uniref:myelin expression factor 2-like isoform X2 n=1 Tax=Ischnura elegans TaxID=197161 RepID=UPI001ED897BF|nr:myelin expression factor 2-like isoform X2 [Ischnura elegans]